MSTVIHRIMDHYPITIDSSDRCSKHAKTRSVLFPTHRGQHELARDSRIDFRCGSWHKELRMRCRLLNMTPKHIPSSHQLLIRSFAVEVRIKTS